MSFTFFDQDRDPLILFLLFLGLVGLYFMAVNPIFLKPEPVSFVTNLKADPLNLVAHVEYLSSLEPTRSHDKKTLDKARLYIEKEFNKHCPVVKTQEFEVSDKQYKNIICTFGAITKKERVVVGAHYDSFENTPGADDNASGVAGILEVARLLAVEKKKLDSSQGDFDRRIDLVAYSLEEPPHFGTPHMGSKIHAKALEVEEALIKTKLVVVLEMIGYFQETTGSQKHPNKIFELLYPTKGNFALIAGRVKIPEWGKTKKFKALMMSAAPDLAIKSFNGLPGRFGIDFSDHASYWEHGFPAILITDTAFYRNPHYHEITDTAETLNYEKMAEVVQGVFWGVLNI